MPAPFELASGFDPLLIVRPVKATVPAVVTLKIRKPVPLPGARRTINWLAPVPEIEIGVLKSGNTCIRLMVQTPSTHPAPFGGILNWMVSVPANAFASSIAARKVHGPLSGSVLITPGTVPQTPSPGFGSLASPVLSTVKVAAVAETASWNPISDTRNARNLPRLAKESLEQPDGAISPRNGRAVPIRSQNNWRRFMLSNTPGHDPI